MSKAPGEKKRVLVILTGSIFFVVFWILLLLPWGNSSTAVYVVKGEIEQAGSPDEVFDALMVPEYKGPKDKTFLYKGICNEEIRVPLEAPVNPVKKVVDNPALQSQEIKALAKQLGADLVGITTLNPKWKFKGVPLDHKYAIVIGEALPYELCREQKDDVKAMMSTRAALDFYSQGGKVALFLAQTIRDMGYPARAHYESWSQVLTVPIVVDAGLGEVGRNSLLITPEFGPRGRYSIVTTDLPVASDTQRKSMGITEFCRICDKCVTACPASAIPAGGATVTRGVVKWQLDLEKCFKYWYQGPDAWSRCLACMTSCPWNKADNMLHRVGSFIASRSPFSRWVILQADTILGYGERVDTTPLITGQPK